VTGTTSGPLPLRRVVIGGQAHDKPWDPLCPACRSPHLRSIDSALAEGYSLRQVRRLLAGLSPAVPEEESLRAHVAHLAEPHRKARLALEEAAAARGDDTAVTSARPQDALAAIIARGTERLVHGEGDVAPRDMVAAMRLLAQLERDRKGEGVEASAWQGAFMSFFAIVRRHLSPAQWKAFTADVYASPEIRAVLAGEAPQGGQLDG
jgi:hypothetical protein